MVMKQRAMAKNLKQSILKSLGRYLAIVAIIALGASMFVGLLMTKSDMVATGQQYMDQQNMFDLRLLTSYGWNMAQVAQIEQMDGVVEAEGVIYLDAIVTLNNSDESVYRLYSIPESINQLDLRGGRLPEAPNECLADGYHASDNLLGTTVTIAKSNDADTLDALVYESYTIVGYVATPLYMDMNRGTTSVGNGSLSSYLFLPPDGLNVDYYAEVHITIPGNYDVYSDDYNRATDGAGKALESALAPLAQERLSEVKATAQAEYESALHDYQDGMRQFLNGKVEAERELEQAQQQLLDGQKQLEDNEQLLHDGETQLEDGERTLKESEKTLKESEQALSDAKAKAYKQISATTTQMLEQVGALTEELTPLQNELTQLESEQLRLNASIAPLETQRSLLDAQISQTQVMISILDSSIQSAETALESAVQNGADAETLASMRRQIAQLEETRTEYAEKLEQQKANRKDIEAELAPLYAQKDVLAQQQQQLEDKISQLESSISSMTETVVTLAASQAVMDAEFEAAQAQLDSGKAQIEQGYLELELRQKELEDGKKELEQAKQLLQDRWQEYEDGKQQLEDELSRAGAELSDAKILLDEAKTQIDAMTDNPVYILDRTSNIGYNSLDSSSDIVQGVSRVFPAFFLLVAALVCITTMTRMIDEERTQIGTLKALGYSNASIISKYLIYAGSGAIVGCGLGVLVGSIAFPTILWQAYKIMLYITDSIVLQLNWLLCGAVVLTYTAVMLFVTWYCCRKVLEEVPAELIRPKAPDAGKKILLEYLPFWNRISFLNKVTIRNIFRYRQRLAMMIVGIGGCTALLLTGFGLRDSIVNVVDYQFEEVTTYDMNVYFSDGRTAAQKEEFSRDLGEDAAQLMFYHQRNIDLVGKEQTKEIYLIAAREGIQEFINFHSGTTLLPLPKDGEVLLSIGVAEVLGIHVGDTVFLRDADMQTLEVLVSGIYDNHVYNYAIVTPQTITSQWGVAPDEQMAFVKVASDVDPHVLSAKIAGMDDVMNISVSADLAQTVGNMMQAMDLVVWVIVFCAGTLAATVLYNLTNINVNERIREIATIKVLGFRAGETAAYVFKENLSLTVIGSVLGLGLGYLLLLFVMSQIKIDLVWFKALATPSSFLLSISLTMLCACIVDILFYFKLEKINMAEALKSVE